MAKTRKLFIRPNIGLEEFIAGETLEYLGFKFKRTEVTYRLGVGVFVSRGEEELGKAEITTDQGARRLYHNLTRKPQSAEGEDEEASEAA